MIGAIAGDMIGSPYDGNLIEYKDFVMVVSKFNDNTVLTVAVAYTLLEGTDFAETIKSFAMSYPRAGYGDSFRRWMWSWDNKPYNSFSSGSAIRVSPVGWAFDTEDEVLLWAKKSAEVTHNHPEGIKGAQATALAIFMARKGNNKEQIREEIERRFGYDMQRTVNDIRPNYSFDVSCQRSVPESIISFLDSASYIDAVKNAISLEGDTDTMACVAGGIAQAYYKKIPYKIISEVRKKLPQVFLAVIDKFTSKYGCEF